MPLPNFTFNPYVKPYVGGIANDLAQVVQFKTNQFYQNAEQDDVLGYQADTLKNLIMDNPADQAYADQILNQTRGELSDRAKKGDYENMFREVKRSARKFSANVAPLLQRKQQQDAYLKAMSEEMGKGNIGRDTYNLAVNYSKKHDRGYDPKDSTTHSFRGFQPTKDESAIDLLKEYYGAEFKGDKIGRKFVHPLTGLTTETEYESSELPAKVSGKFVYYNDATDQYNLDGKEGRKISSIEMAGREGLRGNKKWQNYVTTQRTLGNYSGVQGEMDSALQAEFQRLGKVVDIRKEDTMDSGWLKMLKEKMDDLKPFDAASEVSSPNQTLNPGFQGYLQSPTGKMRQSSDTYRLDPQGNYVKYTDANGKPLTVAQADEYTRMSTGEFATMGPNSVREVKLTPTEVDKVDKAVDAEFTSHVENTYLARYNMHNLPLKQQREFLDKHREEWDNAKNRTQVLKNFNESLKNFAVIEPELWTTKNFSNTVDIEGLNVPKTTDTNTLARNFDGKRIKLLGNNDLGISLEGKEDFNSLSAALAKENYVIDGITGAGLLKINPTNMMSADGAHTLPASSATITVHKGEGATREVKHLKIAVGINDIEKKPFLQVLQDVGNAYLKVGTGAKFVPIKNLGKAGYIVKNVSGSELGVNTPFVGFVQYQDENGNRRGEPKLLQDWQDWYIEQPAPKAEANSYLLNK